MKISSRERLLLVLSGRMPDRVPVSPFVQDEYLSYYYPDFLEKGTRIENVKAMIAAAKAVGGY